MARYLYCVGVGQVGDGGDLIVEDCLAIDVGIQAVQHVSLLPVPLTTDRFDIGLEKHKVILRRSLI